MLSEFRKLLVPRRNNLEDDQEMTPEIAEIHGLLGTMRDRLISLGRAPMPDDLANMEDNYRQSIIDHFSTLTFKGIPPPARPSPRPWINCTWN